MWNESAAADAAARGGRKGAKAPASSIPLGPDGEPLVGRMNNQANPLFLSGSGGALGGSNPDGTGAADAIASMDKPPPPELWSVFRGSFVDMQARAGGARRALLSLSCHSHPAASTDSTQAPHGGLFVAQAQGRSRW